MEKIASPRHLRHELTEILAYASGPSPSRDKLASDLHALADRVSTKEGASRVVTGPALQEQITNGVPGKAVLFFDAYPHYDDGSLELKAGDKPLAVLEKYLSRVWAPISISPGKVNGKEMACKFTLKDGDSGVIKVNLESRKG